MKTEKKNLNIFYDGHDLKCRKIFTGCKLVDCSQYFLLYFT